MPSFGYHLTKIKPYINTYCTYTNISPWPSIVNENEFDRPEAKHVTEKESEVMKTNVDNYQYRTVSLIWIALDFNP